MGVHIAIDPVTRIIDLVTPPTGGFVSLAMRREIYSEAKEDWLSTPALRKVRFPLRDPITALVRGVYVGPFVFVDNASGWRIRPYDADHELTINGDFIAADETSPLFIPRAGRTIIVNIVFSARTQTIAVSGNAPWTDIEKAQIRYVLGVDGASLPISTTPDIVNWIFDELIVTHQNSGSVGEAIKVAKDKAAAAFAVAASR